MRSYQVTFRSIVHDGYGLGKVKERYRRFLTGREVDTLQVIEVKCDQDGNLPVESPTSDPFKYNPDTDTWIHDYLKRMGLQDHPRNVEMAAYFKANFWPGLGVDEAKSRLLAAFGSGE